MKGRKPTPTALSRLHGNPGKRRPSDHEPSPAVADHFPVPDNLGDDARREWQRVVAELQALKMITTLDLNLLAAWATATGDYIAAERQLRQEGLVTDSRDRGLVRNPWLLVRNKAIEQMIRLASELGLSPASRPRFNVPVRVPSARQSAPDRFLEMSLDDYLASRPDPVGHH